VRYFFVFNGAGAVRVLGHFAVLVRCGSEISKFSAHRTTPNHSVLASTGSGAWIPDEDINDEDGPDGGSEEDDFAEMVMDEDYQDYIDDHEEYKKDMADEVGLQLTTG